jgi:hypothetical protein
MTSHFSVTLLVRELYKKSEKSASSSAQARPLRVWNGIFAAGDWRAKRGLKTMSPRRDRKSETTSREKWRQKRPFCLRAVSRGFRKTGWWAHQGSNLGPAD